jgi:hypothetical protein
LIEIAGGFDPARLVFVTAYLDRSRQEFKKTINMLAPGSFAWFAGEPDMVMHLRVSDADSPLHLGTSLD